MKIKLDREKKIELLKWLKQGCAESKTIEAWCSDGENTLRPPSEMTEDEIIAEIEKNQSSKRRLVNVPLDINKPRFGAFIVSKVVCNRT